MSASDNQLSMREFSNLGSNDISEYVAVPLYDVHALGGRRRGYRCVGIWRHAPAHGGGGRARSGVRGSGCARGGAGGGCRRRRQAAAQASRRDASSFPRSSSARGWARRQCRACRDLERRMDTAAILALLAMLYSRAHGARGWCAAWGAYSVSRCRRNG